MEDKSNAEVGAGKPQGGSSKTAGLPSSRSRAVHMDDKQIGEGKSEGGPSKTTGISTSTRLQRNLAEKERRDKLNGFISELATLVPMVSNASKPLDKVSILRLAAAEMRLHFSCLNPKKYKGKPLTLPPAIISSLDLIEKTIGGFIIVTTLNGLIVFCSRSIEDYLGYQNIDVMGNKVVKYIYEDDIKYFEAKVNSVVNSLKKGSKKKTKVIKAHMLQKPLPRSNESSRPRNMIFKISVHQNDTNDSNINGTKNQSSSVLKKTRPPRDFGYSSVVLMFIEPVRLEPEIDITYIDSNQDVYFTRHGLQGEIIYADQRISSITGYMPHDVQGTSAYQYICSSDVPIALFAQKAMFTSNDGKGVIVYRLRIRDMRFIYLQSSGQIAYKESSSQISHFVCFNRLLSEEEGSQELKRFQQRYAPQIMAAKMLQVKQGAKAQPDNNIDLAFEQALKLMDPSAITDIRTSAEQMSPYESTKDSSSEGPSGSSDQKSSIESFVSPTGSLVAPSSVHSPQGHSIISPISSGRSSSVGSDYSPYASEQVEFSMKRPEKRTSVRTDYAPFAPHAYESVNVGKNERSFRKEELESGVKINGYDHPLVINKPRQPENNVNVNGSYRNEQNCFAVSAKSQNKMMHSVNAYNNLQGSIAVNGSTEETLSEHPMDLIFDSTLQQKNASFNLNPAPNTSKSYAVQSNGMLSVVNGEQGEYVSYNGQSLYVQPGKTNNHFHTSQNNLQLSVSHSAAPTTLCDQPSNFNREQIPRSGVSHLSDLSSFSGMCEVSSVSSLSKSQLSVASDLSDVVDYCPSISSYHDDGSYSSSYFPNDVISFNNGANTEIYNGIDTINSEAFTQNPCERNNFHVSNSPIDVHGHFSSMGTLDPMDTSEGMAALNNTPDKRVEKLMDIGNIGFPGTGSLKQPMTACLNGSSDAIISKGIDSHVGPLGWNGLDVHLDPTGGGDLPMNEELYRELDLFFQNLPQSNTSGDVSIARTGSEFPVAATSFPENSISSSEGKTNYHP